MARPLTVQDRDEIWDLVMAGGTHGRVGKKLGRPTSVVRSVIVSTGGIRPVARCRGVRQLTVAEREDIAAGVAGGLLVRAIATGLGRAPSTISRELMRNGGRGSYRPSVAEQAAWRRAARPKTCKLAANAVLREHVVEGLKLQWSPEQITGWLTVEFPDDPELRVSHETIYLSLFVQSNGLLNRHVATLVERTSRFVQIIKLENKTTDCVIAALTARIQDLPGQLKQSLTWDRGMEMAQHKRFTIDTGVQVYFCDPQSPWQRGTNENTNGLIRQYLPQGMNLNQVTQERLDEIAHRLNSRPRKTLGFMTPSGKLSEVLQ